MRPWGTSPSSFTSPAFGGPSQSRLQPRAAHGPLRVGAHARRASFVSASVSLGALGRSSAVGAGAAGGTAGGAGPFRHRKAMSMAHVLGSVNSLNLAGLLSRRHLLGSYAGTNIVSTLPNSGGAGAGGGGSSAQAAGGSGAGSRVPSLFGQLSGIGRIQEEPSQPLTSSSSAVSAAAALGPSASGTYAGPPRANGTLHRVSCPPASTEQAERPQIARGHSFNHPGSTTALPRPFSSSQGQLPRADSAFMGFAPQDGRQASVSNSAPEELNRRLAFVSAYRHLGRVVGGLVPRATYVAPMPFVRPVVTVAMAHDPRSRCTHVRLNYSHLEVHAGMYSVATMVQMGQRVVQVCAGGEGEMRGCALWYACACTRALAHVCEAGGWE